MLNSLPIINGNFVFTFSYKKNGGIQTHLEIFLKIIVAVAIQNVFLFKNILKLYIFYFKKNYF
jgi:hypothetical protein